MHVSSESSYSSSASDTKMAFGVMDASNISVGESLSGLFSVGQNWVQAMMGIYQTKGSFDFAVGGIFKFTVVGSNRNGFHVGPGLNLGSINDEFAWAFFGAAGGHFTIVDHMIFSVDAGPMLTHTKNNTNFRIRALGQLLGASVHFLF